MRATEQSAASPRMRLRKIHKRVQWKGGEAGEISETANSVLVVEWPILHCWLHEQQERRYQSDRRHKVGEGKILQ